MRRSTGNIPVFMTPFAFTLLQAPVLFPAVWLNKVNYFVVIRVLVRLVKGAYKEITGGRCNPSPQNHRLNPKRNESSPRNTWQHTVQQFSNTSRNSSTYRKKQQPLRSLPGNIFHTSLTPSLSVSAEAGRGLASHAADKEQRGGMTQMLTWHPYKKQYKKQLQKACDYTAVRALY